MVAGFTWFHGVALADEPGTHGPGGTPESRVELVESVRPDDEAWQRKMLFEPSEEVRRMEERGRVMIYSGLRETDVDAAMEGQFDRIERMMFIRTIKTDKLGTPLMDELGNQVVNDEDC